MKKKFLTILLLLAIASTAFAFQNEPNGFRDLKWGASIEEFKQSCPEATYRQPKDIELKLSKNVTYYNVPANGTTLSSIVVSHPLEYSFYKNKLESVKVDLSEPYNFMTLQNQKESLAKIEHMFIKANVIFDNKNINDFNPVDFSDKSCFMYTWDGDTANISMIGTYNDPVANESHLLITITSTQIYNQRLTEQRMSESSFGW